MPVERADGKLTLGSGTIGLILAVVGAAWDYWIDGNVVFLFTHRINHPWDLF